MRRIALTLLLLSLPLAAVAKKGGGGKPEKPPTETNATLLEAFQAIRSTTVWPVPTAGPDQITSTFGPRIKVSTQAYDWHRGIDISANQGAAALAVADGVFYDIQEFTNGGTTVILRHEFPEPVDYAGKTLTYYYTFYMHLDSVTPELVAAEAAGERPPVAAGFQIGGVGHSGTAVSDHLHLEVRVGTSCSLEHQVNNPELSCAQWEFDPHMHPMWLFEPIPGTVYGLTGGSTPTATTDGVVRFESPDDQALLNRIEFTIAEKKRGRVVATHTLDFNERKGYDATSTAALDTPDVSKPYISPLPFGHNTMFRTDIVLPALFVGNSFGSRYKSTLKVTDIWGVATTIEW